MYVATVPNRNSPPAILLRESFRHHGKVLNRTLANLSHWPRAQVDALRAVLKGATSVTPATPSLKPSRLSAPALTATSLLSSAPCANYTSTNSSIRNPATIAIWSWP
jgi:hypothetical protein